MLRFSTETRTARSILGRLLKAFVRLVQDWPYHASALPSSMDLEVRKQNRGDSLLLLFPIYVKNISKAKHGSDSGVYDKEGRFVPEKFEEIFFKHAHTNSEALTSDELKELLKSNREPKDHRGWVGGFVEWKILYYLCKDKNGLLPKHIIRGLYDGSLFVEMEKERVSKSKKHQ